MLNVLGGLKLMPGKVLEGRRGNTVQPSEEFAEEKSYFNRIKESLLSEHEGDFVVIKGHELIGIFPDDISAFKAGMDKFGTADFLLVKISRRTDIAVSPLLARDPAA